MFGLLPHVEVEVIKNKEGVLIRRKETNDRRGDELIRHMTKKHKRKYDDRRNHGVDAWRS